MLVYPGLAAAIPVFREEGGGGVVRLFGRVADFRKVRSRGGKTIALNVITPNPAAVRLYERVRFRIVSTHRAWVPYRTLAVLTMTYDAGEAVL
ncbi:MAG TPA: hypothetical protein PLG75_02635 [Methanoculleus sp.]|nr:hypothetical protein [Methanoculleus sp.]